MIKKYILIIIIFNILSCNYDIFNELSLNDITLNCEIEMLPNNIQFSLNSKNNSIKGANIFLYQFNNDQKNQVYQEIFDYNINNKIISISYFNIVNLDCMYSSNYQLEIQLVTDFQKLPIYHNFNIKPNVCYYNKIVSKDEICINYKPDKSMTNEKIILSINIKNTSITIEKIIDNKIDNNDIICIDNPYNNTEIKDDISITAYFIEHCNNSKIPIEFTEK